MSGHQWTRFRTHGTQIWYKCCPYQVCGKTCMICIDYYRLQLSRVSHFLGILLVKFVTSPQMFSHGTDGAHLPVALCSWIRTSRSFERSPFRAQKAWILPPLARDPVVHMASCHRVKWIWSHPIFSYVRRPWSWCQPAIPGYKAHGIPPKIEFKAWWLWFCGIVRWCQRSTTCRTAPCCMSMMHSLLCQLELIPQTAFCVTVQGDLSWQGGSSWCNLWSCLCSILRVVVVGWVLLNVGYIYVHSR